MSTKNKFKKNRAEKKAKKSLRQNIRGLRHKRYQTKQLRLEITMYTALKLKAVEDGRPASKVLYKIIRPALSEYIRSAKILLNKKGGADLVSLVDKKHLLNDYEHNENEQYKTSTYERGGEA